MDDRERLERQKLLDTREKSQVEAVPRRPDFFEWLERLFDGAQFPEKLETRVVQGKNFERLGPMIKQIIFPPKAVKPTKEMLVALSNELLFLMQRDCDIQRKSVVYGVHCAHFSRDNDFYERWLHRATPSPLRANDGIARDDAEEEQTQDARFSSQVLTHHERLFQLYGGGFEGLLDRFDRVLERQETRIIKQDERIEKLSEMLERSLSLEAERAEKREWNQLKIRSVEKALDLGLAIAPPLVNQIAGKQVIPTNDSSEAITLRGFFKKTSEGGSLTEEQAVKAFGTDDGKPGILSFDQAKLLWDVAHCKASPDELDKLLPGGGLAVTPEQFVALQTMCGFAQEQIAPLYLLFQNRMKHKAA